MAKPAWLASVVVVAVAAASGRIVLSQGKPEPRSPFLASPGSIEKGKFGDVIAVAGNPLTDVTEMERVKFVMKGGVVVKNDLPGPRTSSTGQ
jgi:hypothetical protein